MAQHYILDGYNVLNALPELREILERDSQEARTMLKQQVELYCRTGEIAATIVYDSKSYSDAFDAYGSSAQPFIVFTGFAREADDYIIEAAETYGSANTTVVSNDNKIREASARAGCSLMTPAEFMNLVRKKSRGRPGMRPKKYKKDDLSKDEIDEWLDLFNREQNDDQN